MTEKAKLKTSGRNDIKDSNEIKESKEAQEIEEIKEIQENNEVKDSEEKEEVTTRQLKKPLDIMQDLINEDIMEIDLESDRKKSQENNLNKMVTVEQPEPATEPKEIKQEIKNVKSPEPEDKSKEMLIKKEDKQEKYEKQIKSELEPQVQPNDQVNREEPVKLSSSKNNQVEAIEKVTDSENPKQVEKITVPISKEESIKEIQPKYEENKQEIPIELKKETPRETLNSSQEKRITKKDKSKNDELEQWKNLNIRDLIPDFKFLSEDEGKVFIT